MSHYYVIVRSDLPVEIQACQIAHACIGAGKLFQHPDELHLVLLHVANEEELLRLSWRLIEKEVPHFVNREPDLDNSLTAIATSPVVPEKRKYFRQFGLWRKSA